MRKLILFFLLLAGTAYGQSNNTTNTKFTNGLAAPNGATQKPTSGLTAGALSYVTGAGLYVYNGSSWVLLGLSSGGVTSFNSRTGVVVPEIGDYSSFYVPLTRSLTINGATQTLAADRTWTITALTPFSLSTGYGLTGGVFDGSVARTYAADTLSVNGLVSKLRLATNLTGYVKKATTITINGVTQDLSDNRIWTAGTVTSITPGYGLTPQTAITSTGGFGVDTLVLDTVYAKPSDMPTNYWTTNTTQSGLTGNKTTTGNITADSLTATQSITAGKNINIPSTSSTAGVIYQNSQRLMHTYAGSTAQGRNFFAGLNSGNLTGDHYALTAVGDSTLNKCISCYSIDVSGTGSLAKATSVFGASVHGTVSYPNKVSGNSIAAVGWHAGLNDLTGSRHAIVGTEGFRSCLDCVGITGIGDNVGVNSTADSVVYIGLEAGYNNTVSKRGMIDISATDNPLIDMRFGTRDVILNAKLSIDSINALVGAASSILTAESGVIKSLSGAQARTYIGAGTGDGTVTSVTSANSDISVANTTTTPVLTLASGTGTGSIVRATSPVLTTPNVGAASGTSLNLNSGAISGGYLLGGNVNSTGVTDATRKYMTLATPHYTNAQAPVSSVIADANSTTNTIFIGGGQGALNAATEVAIYAAANNTTLTGTKIASVTSTGVAVTGNISATNLASGSNTPTIVNGTNVTSSSANKETFYNRVLTGVSFTATINIATTSTGNTSFEFTPPVASNFTSTADGSGSITWTATDATAVNKDFTFNTSIANDRIVVTFTATTAGNSVLFITGHYKIL